MKNFIKIITLVLLLGISLFSKEVGSVTAYSGKASILRDGEVKELTLGLRLQEKDTVITEKNSKVQIIFNDETIITIGKSSKFSIDEYMYENDQEPNLQFGLLQGAMRTITGKIGKIAPDKFKVETKTATIGIRGTNFTIVQREDNIGDIYCTYGTITVTINSYENIIKQGFYAHIADGTTVVKAFSVKELKSLHKANFSSTSNDKSSDTLGNKLEGILEASKETQFDTTKDVFQENINKELLNDVQDAKQTSIPEDYHHYIINPTDNEDNSNIKLANLVGTSITKTEDINLGASNLKLNFSDTSYEPSEMGLYLTSSNGTYELWYLYVRDPSSIQSQESYTTDFSSVSISTFNNDSSSSNPRVATGKFEAIDDDLVSGDAMTWGKWEASLLYDNNQGANQIHDLYGLWIVGDKTSSSIVDSLVGSAVSYEGIYKAIEYSTNNLVHGSALMEIDFGADTALLSILYGTGREFDLLLLSDNSLSGYQTAPEYGIVNGNFYGSDGSLIGGSFSTTSGGYESVELKGVYELARTDVPDSSIAAASQREGWSINYTTDSYYDTVKYEISNDKTFVEDNSYLVINALESSTGEYDYWELKLSPEISTYISDETFVGSFSSATIIPPTGGKSKYGEIVSSTFMATGDDLAVDDYMSWGLWNAELTYENEDGAQSHSVSGFWQAGEVTPVSIVDAITSNSVDYNGIYRAVDLLSQDIVNGEASMNVNFGADTATLDLAYDNGRTFDMTISGNTLSGGMQVNEGEAYGTFYGPDASSIGGNFSTRTANDAKELKGVYQVSR